MCRHLGCDVWEKWSMSSDIHMLQAIQDAYVDSTSKDRTVVANRAFVAMLNIDDPLKYLNGAIPIQEPTQSDVAWLISAYRDNCRTPFLEFFSDLWPSLPQTLEEAGFVKENEHPIMILRRTDWTTIELPFEISISRSTVDDCDLLARVTSSAFEDCDDISIAAQRSQGEMERFLRAISSGRWLAVLARYANGIAGAGLAVGNNSIREVAGVGTLPKFRRRGVARAVTSALTEWHFENGGELAWLTPGDAGAEGVYSSVGYRHAGTQVCYSLAV